MVCNRCIMVLQNELDKFGYQANHISLGEVLLKDDMSFEQKDIFNKHLKTLGFEIIDDKKSQLIAQIKAAIIEVVHQQNINLKINFSAYLSAKLEHDYTYLSNLFSEVEGTTIEKYFIAQKIEKVIANQLNYSSVAYLSNQFKKITGLTPTFFKNIKAAKRKPLDEV